MRKTIISTEGITNYLNTRPVKERKATEHSPEFISKRENKLREKLIIKLKTEDPRNFINDENLIKIQRLPGEEFKLIPGTTKYYVSNMGRALKLVYDQFTDVFLEHPMRSTKSKNKTGRYYLDIYVVTIDGEHIRCRLSRAILRTFVDNGFPLRYNKLDTRVADHIDNNSENNKLTNLRICTQSENLQFAVLTQNRYPGRPTKKCYAYNINTKELREYPSLGELCRDIWNSSNKGYFHTAYNNKSTTRHGWKVSYNKEAFNEKK